MIEHLTLYLPQLSKDIRLIKNMIPAVTGVEPTAPDIEETVTYVKDAQKSDHQVCQ